MGRTLHFLKHTSVVVEYDADKNQQSVITVSGLQQPAFDPRLFVPPTTFHPAFNTSLSDAPPSLKNRQKVPGFKRVPRISIQHLCASQIHR